MRIAWNIIAFVAVSNLLGIAIFLGWLGMTGRMDGDRIESLRVLFAEPVTVIAAREQEEALLAVAMQEAAAQEASLGHLSAGSRIPIDSLQLVAQKEQVIMKKLQDEHARDQRKLLAHERALDAREKALDERIAAFEKRIADMKAMTRSQEFATVVKVLESLPPRQGKDQILLLAADGRSEEAAAYLRAMRSGPRTEIIAAMKSEEELKVASHLLDVLRGGASMQKPDSETIDASPLAQSDPG